MSARVALATALGLIAGAHAACDEATAVSIPAVERGRELFADPGLSASQFNVFACATCHGTTRDARPPIAFDLAGVTERPSWWGGSVTTLYQAVDLCYVYFMRGFPSLDPTSDDARALFELLASLGDGQPDEARPLTIVENVADVGRGDADAGRQIYNRSCEPCHGAPHTGAGRLGELVSIVPEASQELAVELGVDARLVVIEKIRHGQFFGVGGNMPPYPLEIMTDAELADLLEYLDP